MPTLLEKPVAKRIATHQRKVCSACGQSALEEVLSFPKLPLTGIFIDPAARGDYSSFDQELLRCAACGHGQLRDSIDPTYLYQKTYTHRSSLSPISTRGNDFFHAFITEIVPERQFQSIAEIGCNDLYLLNKLAARGEHLTGFDPIWKDVPAPPEGKIRVVPKYIEEIKAADFPAPPDLVLSVHTMEHVEYPLRSLQPIFDHAQVGALFFIEVPSFDTLLTIRRFDQIFHQHLNYFCVSSIQRMIECMGGEYLTHRFNYGYWLGTMMVAFRKPNPGDTSAPRRAKRAKAISSADIRESYRRYRNHLGGVMTQLDDFQNRGIKIAGFGAAQMVPTLAYHLDTDLAFLEAILDDNPEKDGRTYPSIATTIRNSKNFPHLRDYAMLLTACDSARTLIPRLTDLQARYIVVPNSPF